MHIPKDHIVQVLVQNKEILCTILICKSLFVRTLTKITISQSCRKRGVLSSIVLSDQNACDFKNVVSLCYLPFFLCSHWPISQSDLLNLLLIPLKTMPQLGMPARVYQYSNTVEKKVLCRTIHCHAQEQASMAKTCQQFWLLERLGKSSLSVLHLSSRGCNS